MDPSCYIKSFKHSINENQIMVGEGMISRIISYKSPNLRCLIFAAINMADSKLTASCMRTLADRQLLTKHACRYEKSKCKIEANSTYTG